MKTPMEQPVNLLEVNTPYSITLNPNDSHQYAGKQDRMEKFRNNYYGITVKWAQLGINYVLYTELSEPKNSNGTIGPRLHLHGIIKFKTNEAIKRFLLFEYYELTRCGIVDIDTIDDMDYWQKYIQKQQHIINETPLTNLTKSKAKPILPEEE